MIKIDKTYINALLADSAYVNDLVDGLSGNTLRDVLSPRMTLTLAQFISDNFTVISAHDSPDAPFGWSFEGVVWQGNSGTPYAGQTYVSMRGTQQLTDFLVDGDLALYGAARDQIAEMTDTQGIASVQLRWKTIGDKDGSCRGRTAKQSRARRVNPHS